MPAIASQPPPQAPSDVTTYTLTARDFPDQEFVNLQNVPVFKEHETLDPKGRPLKFGYGELKAVADRCNQRIAESGDYSPLTIGHTPSPEAKAMGAADPEVVGLAGPFRLGKQQGSDKWEILADLHYYREDWDRVRKKYPRRSPELWSSSGDYTQMFLDPIALLGAETPRLDMGLVYNRAGHPGKLYRDGRGVMRYAKQYAAVMPGSMSVHLENKPKEYDAMDNATGGADSVNPQLIKDIVDAIQQLPVWQFMESQMVQMESEGATQGTDTVGDAMPGAPPQAGMTPSMPPAAPPTMNGPPGAVPQATAPTPMEPEAAMVKAPPSPPLDAPGGDPGLDAPGGDEPASEEPPKPKAEQPPFEKKEKNNMKAMYAALDAMDDDERDNIAKYMASKYRKNYAAGGPEVEGTMDEGEPSNEAGSYSPKPNAEGVGTSTENLNIGGGDEPDKSPQKMASGNYARSATDSPLKYQLDQMRQEVDKLKAERDEARIQAIDEGRLARIWNAHHNGLLAGDPTETFETLKYSMVQSDEHFEKMLRLMAKSGKQIPVGRTLPNVPGAERHVYEKAQRDLLVERMGLAPSRYSRAHHEAATAAVNRRVEQNARKPDPESTTGWYEEELEKAYAANGAA